MHTAIVTVPNTFLFENPANKCISDELLSGWIVTVQKQQGNFLKVTTHYGYTGWLDASAVCSISLEKTDPSPAILCRRITDVLAEPKVQSCILSTLFMGSAVTAVNAPQDGWQKIKTAGGVWGYVPSISLLYPKRTDMDSAQLRSAILSYARSYLGVQYRWGGKTHEGIDCSGLTFMSYYMCGILIYRDAAIADGYPVREIPFSQIQPADLLYFPGHVALYLGNDRYIHSTGNPASFGCVINSLNPRDSDYRKDLAHTLTAVGSVFS